MSLGASRLLIDCGSGVAQRLVAAGQRGADLDALIVTHYHSDHVIDFYQLLVSSWHQGRARPFVVHAARARSRICAGSSRPMRDERKLRIAHERRPSTASGSRSTSTNCRRADRSRSWSLSAEPFEVDHRLVDAGLCRPRSCALPGSRIVFSGRCGAGASARSGGAGCRPPRLRRGLRRARDAAGARHTLGRDDRGRALLHHMTPGAVAALADKAKVKALALTHLVPPQAERAALVAEIRETYRGPVIVGEDLMAIDIEARTIAFPGLFLGY